MGVSSLPVGAAKRAAAEVGHSQRLNTHAQAFLLSASAQVQIVEMKRQLRIKAQAAVEPGLSTHSEQEAIEQLRMTPRAIVADMANFPLGCFVLRGVMCHRAQDLLGGRPLAQVLRAKPGGLPWVPLDATGHTHQVVLVQSQGQAVRQVVVMATTPTPRKPSCARPCKARACRCSAMAMS